MTDDRTYLGHIIDCIQRIEDYTRDDLAFVATPARSRCCHKSPIS